MTRAANPWCPEFTPAASARVRLYCFSHGGAGSSLFHEWRKGLHREIEVCAIVLPGREVRFREAPFTSMATLLPELARDLSGHIDRPYAIFGHSVGGLVGFELARELARAGAAPLHLFVSARDAPHLPPSSPPVSHLPDSEFIAELERRYGAMEQAILREPELMEILLSALRADVKLIETYRHVAGEPLDCPITAFGGTGDPSVTADRLAAWREHTREKFSLEMFPGGHFYLRDSRQRAALMRSIERSLLALETPQRLGTNRP